MGCTVAAALRRLASEHNITALPDKGLEQLLGTLSAGDYDGMYEALGKVIAFFPSHLHEQLFEVASDALPQQEEQIDQDEDIVRLQEDADDQGERAGSASGRSDTAGGAKTGMTADSDDEAFLEELRATVEAARREAEEGDEDAEIAEEREEEAADIDEGEYGRNKNNESASSDVAEYDGEDRGDVQGAVPSAAEEEQDNDYATVLSRAISANLELEEALRHEVAHLDSLLSSTNVHSSELREVHAALPNPIESSLQSSTAPSWISQLSSGDGYIFGLAAQEEKLLSIAGALRSWDVNRPFGTSYFAAMPDSTSGSWYASAPADNADVTAMERRGVPRRAIVARAYCRATWSAGEKDDLQGALCRRLGGGELRDEGKREKAKQWEGHVWEAIAEEMGGEGRKREVDEIRNRAVNVEMVRGGGWTKEEDARLKEAVGTYTSGSGSGGWEAVGQAVGGGRSGMEALRRWRALEEGRVGKGRWSSEEDKVLMQATERLGKGNWAGIGLVVGRPGQACLARVGRQVKTRRVGKWEELELELLRRAVKEVGQDWVKVGRIVGSRSNVQCREKWVNCEDAKVLKGPWKREEDEKLREMVGKEGRKWVKVAEGVEGRTDAQCQKRWKRLCAREGREEGRKSKRKKVETGKAGGPGEAESGCEGRGEEQAGVGQVKDGDRQRTG